MGDRFEYCGVRVEGDGGPIVEGFSARIPAEGVTVMAGPSGIGKTTLLRLLNRLDDPDEGRVLFEGTDVRDLDVLELRRLVQHVGQVPVTFPGSVAHNLDAGRGVRARARGHSARAVPDRGSGPTGAPSRDSGADGRGRDGPASDGAAPDPVALLERVGLSQVLLARDADRLSVGEAQRMALARALARGPTCLLLDEPTSALDDDSKRGVEQLLRSLAGDGLTIVMVTHDRGVAHRLGDRVLEIGTGRCQD